MSHGKITAIMITRPSRFGLAQRAIINFFDQDYPDKELIVVAPHDMAGLQGWYRKHANSPEDRTQFEDAPSDDYREKLKAGFRLVQGDWIVLWDDDNQSHPRRLSRQVEFAAQAPDRPCYLQDAFYYFFDSKEVFPVSMQGSHPVDRVVPQTLMFPRSMYAEGAEPLVGMGREFSRLRYRARIIRYEPKWFVLGVRGDGMQPYSKYRQLVQKHNRTRSWPTGRIYAMREELEETLNAFTWNDEVIHLCGHDGAAFDMDTYRQWGEPGIIGMRAVGAPDNVTRIDE